MDTFLQIIVAACVEAGVSSGPSSLEAAVGIERKMTGYVRDAWIDVQQFRPDWPWMFKEFTFNTSPSKQRYPCSELSLTDVEHWDLAGASIYRTSDGKSGELPLGTTNYGAWWKYCRIGEQTPAPPSQIFVDPSNNDLMLNPIPDDEYTVTIRYYRAAQRLTVATDVPLMPTNQAWQDIIKWGALKYYGYHDGAPDTLAEATERYDDRLFAMDNKLGTQICISGSPIA